MKKSKNKRQNQPAAQPLVSTELASAQEYFKSRMLLADVVRPLDKILLEHGGSLKTYRNLLYDEQVKACFIEQRVAAAVAAPWEIVPATEDKKDVEIAAFIEENLKNIGFKDKYKKMLYGNWFGYSVAEILYKIENSRIVIAAINVKKPERFDFKYTGELFLKKDFASLELMPARKFWIYKNCGDNDDEVYGLGLGHVCFWPVYLKRNGLKFWSVAVEKFAVPTARGTYRTGATDEEKRELLQMLASISQETSIVVEDGTTVDLLEAVRNSGGDFEKFCGYLDKIIAKAILGQDGTSQNGAYVGTAEIQENVKDLIIKSDAELLDESFNEVIKWLVEFNFPGAIPPKLMHRFEAPEDLMKAADQDTKIYNMGFEPSEKYINEKYGGEWKKRETSSFPTEPAFAEPEPTAAEKTAAELTDDWEQVMTPIVEPVEEILADCSSFAEFEERLTEAYPKMNIAKLQELIAQADFKARVSGKLGISND